jgi:uncharacterized membrane protein
MARNVNDIHQEKLSFNDKLALKITSAVGNMFCAYCFALLALISFPNAVSGGIPTFVPWLAQTFLQLVLLSVIMVGQNLQQRHSELRAEEEYETTLKAEEDITDVKNMLVIHGQKIDFLLTKAGQTLIDKGKEVVHE